MTTSDATEKKPLWLSIEERVLQLDSQDFSGDNLETSIQRIAGELDDAGVITVLQREANRRRDTIAELKQVNRPEMLTKEEAELAILEGYLPQLLSREEIAEEARQVIAEVGATGMKQMGPVMRRLMPKLKGRADGRVVNQVVRELLAG